MSSLFRPESDKQGEDLGAYIHRLPKAELHLHLEGSITPSMFMELSRRYKTEYASLNEEEVTKQLFCYKDFQDFLDTYRVVCQHLREPEDYLRILERLSEYFRQQNIRYAEIIYAPSISWEFKRDGRAILEALLAKSREIESTHGVLIRWILDCVRMWGPGLARRTAELAAEFHNSGVVALGLGGDENSLQMKDYEEVFTWARAHQLFVHVHAGEVGEPQQVWDAVRILGANRIGHGIQAARDPKLMDYLREHAIGLDVCLTSNSRTGAWTPVSDSPFGLLYKRGVPVTLNTDDPGLFQTSLNDEIKKAARFFALTQSDVCRIVLRGVHASFLPYEQKATLMQQFQEDFRTLA